MDIYMSVERQFSAEGFLRLDVLEVLKEIFSSTEAHRLFKEGAVKIWDTRVQDGKVFWYKRSCNRKELVEKGEWVLVGRRAIQIRAKPINIFKKVFYYVRPYVERCIETVGGYNKRVKVHEL